MPDLTTLVRTYGYAVVFLLVGIESLGVPLPGEAALLTAAALAARGDLRIEYVIATAALAAIIGDNFGYWIGRKGGIAFIRRYGRIFWLDDAKLAKLHAYFARFGPATVFLGRFMALLRTWAALLAGAGEMRWPTFTLYNALGGVVWAGLYGTLAYQFGRNLPRLEHGIGRISWALAVLAIVVLLLFLVWRRRALRSGG